MDNILYEKSKCGEDIVGIERNARKIYLNSKYDARKDIEIYLNGFEIKKNSIIILFGIESGKILEALNEKLENGAKVICYEPIEELANNILNKELDLKYEFTIISPQTSNKHELYLDIKNIFKAMVSSYELKKVVIITQKKYEELFPDQYKNFFEGFTNALKENQLDFNTLDYFAELHIKNFIRNIKYIAESPNIEKLEGLFKSKPAIIVSAGPSLEKNFKLLKGNEDKFIIITGGRTLKVLLEAGIKPHFVASMDPGYNNFDLFKDVLDTKIPMVCQWLNNYKIVELYSGVKFFINNTYVENIDEDLIGRKMIDFDQGGSVATSQFSLARYLGCNPIAFIGQDLAYTGNKMHADIASYDKDDNKVEFDKVKVEKVKGNVEDEVYMDLQFKYFKEWFEKAIRMNRNLNIYNCTEGGAYIEGTIIETLKNYIEKYSKEDTHYSEKMIEILEENKENNKSIVAIKTIRKIQESVKVVIKIVKEAINIIEIIDSRINKGKNIDIFLSKLDKIDAKIKKEEENSKFVVYFIQKELNILQNVELDNEENPSEILKVNKRFYETVKMAYEKALEIIEEMKLD